MVKRPISRLCDKFSALLVPCIAGHMKVMLGREAVGTSTRLEVLKKTGWNLCVVMYSDARLPPNLETASFGEHFKYQIHTYSLRFNLDHAGLY